MSTLTYNWTFGEVDVRDEDGLEKVAVTVHNIRCTSVDEDGFEFSDFLRSHTLPSPDPDNFEAIISSADDAEGAQAQRRAWVGEARISVWESLIETLHAEAKERSAANPQKIK